MKTKVRIQYGQITHIPGSQCQQVFISILTKRFVYAKDDTSLETVGVIRLQRTMDDQDRWYGLNFEMNTDKVEHFEKMLKVVKFIKASQLSYTFTIEDLLTLIGATEYGYYNGEFLPITDEGKNFYRIMGSNQMYYASIIAKDLGEACKAFKKWNLKANKHDAVLTFDSVVAFNRKSY